MFYRPVGLSICVLYYSVLLPSAHYFVECTNRKPLRLQVEIDSKVTLFREKLDTNDGGAQEFCEKLEQAEINHCTHTIKNNIDQIYSTFIAPCVKRRDEFVLVIHSHSSNFHRRQIARNSFCLLCLDIPCSCLFYIKDVAKTIPGTSVSVEAEEFRDIIVKTQPIRLNNNQLWFETTDYAYVDVKDIHLNSAFLLKNRVGVCYNGILIAQAFNPKHYGVYQNQLEDKCSKSEQLTYSPRVFIWQKNAFKQIQSSGKDLEFYPVVAALHANVTRTPLGSQLLVKFPLDLRQENCWAEVEADEKVKIHSSNSVFNVPQFWIKEETVGMVQVHDSNTGYMSDIVLYDSTRFVEKSESVAIHIFTDIHTQERIMNDDLERSRIIHGQFKSRCFIAFLFESPVIMPKMYEAFRHPSVHNRFDRIFTFDDSLLSINNSIFYPFLLGGSRARPCNDGIGSHSTMARREGISFIFSNKSKTHGHRLRHLVWKRFQNHSAYIYGCGSGAGLTLIAKETCLQGFRFSIVIENSKDNQGYYFSEKLIDALINRVIPIYWGSRSGVSKVFDTTSILFFDNLDELSFILSELLGTEKKQDAEYRKLKESVEFNRNVAMRLADANPFARIFRHLVGPNGELSSLCVK